ncbi:MAG: lipopolysaccharide heptosyltransferase II [Candidatus Omnitrophota bacterium]
MNILQILPELKVGGVETGTVDLARYLVKNGHKAVVISGGGRLVKQLKDENIRHYELPVGKKSLFTIITMIGRVAEIIKQEEIDIVHARSRVPAIVAFFASKIARATFITTAHGYYKRHLFSRVMGWGKFVIVASNVMARHMMENFGVPHDRIKLIPRGVDLDSYRFRQDPEKSRSGCRIGMIGRITPIKGHSYFIRAIASLWRNTPNIKAVIVGEAPSSKAKYKEELVTLSRRLGISDIVEFAGHSSDIPGVLSKLDILVLSSVVPEGFGRVIVEAQACGVPVVATRVGGVVDIIQDGVNGLLVFPQDSQSLAEAISRLMNDRPLAVKIAAEARRVVEEKFSLEKMMQNTIAVYKEALSTKKILMIKMSAMGDCILAIPSARAIRKKFQNGNIKVLVDVKFRNVFKGCPYINETIVCDFDGKHKGPRGFLKLTGELRKEHFDIVVDLQNNRKSHLLSFLSTAPLRFGYNNGKLGFLLNRKIRDKGPLVRPILHQFRVLSLLGIDVKDEGLELWHSEQDAQWAEEFLQQNWISSSQRLIGINMGASERWLTKRWPAEYIAKLCDALAKQMQARVIITGIKKDIPHAQKVLSMTKSKPIIACGKTNLSQLCALMKKCGVFVTGDSAPMHIATAIGVPFVALFGPTDPIRHVNAARDFIVLKKDMRCAPCYRSRCILNYRCMKKITVEEVLSAIKELMKPEKAAYIHSL